MLGEQESENRGIIKKGDGEKRWETGKQGTRYRSKKMGKKTSVRESKKTGGLGRKHEGVGGGEGDLKLTVNSSRGEKEEVGK